MDKQLQIMNLKHEENKRNMMRTVMEENKARAANPPIGLYSVKSVDFVSSYEFHSPSYSY
jgi:hypothetical protein